MRRSSHNVLGSYIMLTGAGVHCADHQHSSDRQEAAAAGLTSFFTLKVVLSVRCHVTRLTNEKEVVMLCLACPAVSCRPARLLSSLPAAGWAAHVRYLHWTTLSSYYSSLLTPHSSLHSYHVLTDLQVSLVGEREEDVVPSPPHPPPPPPPHTGGRTGADKMRSKT